MKNKFTPYSSLRIFLFIIKYCDKYMKFIKNYNQIDLKNYLAEKHSQNFRANQIFDFIYNQNKSDFDEMINLPAALINDLKQDFEYSSIESAKSQTSDDGTIKYLFTLKRGFDIESVLIPDLSFDEKEKYTLCISTQAGCAVGCKFCATGKLMVKENLETAEILDQYFTVKKMSGKSISNIVFMGMGEPLNNYSNVVKTIKMITDSDFGIIGRRRITLSTVGIVPRIRQLAEEKLGIKLAISLHATTDEQREQLIPIARKWQISDLIDAAEYYYRSNRLPITYEYILFEGFNDSYEDVKNLSSIIKRFPSKVNLIPFHSSENLLDFNLTPASPERINHFKGMLDVEGVHAFIRQSAGDDIDAACGQLAYKNWDNSY